MLKVLLSLNKSKSPGPDNIHPRILKELAHEISYPLTKLFNASMKHGQIPKDWKIAEVKPIFKKGDKSSPGNYRPVSLTSVVCKIFETFVRDALYEHLTSNKLLSPDQFGFCKGRSCVSQLLVTVNEWMQNMDMGLPVDTIYLDFAKAFDTVPHNRLLHKLRAYGISGNLLEWIQDFLSDRSQFVSISGISSGQVPVTSGVPQGSVLGPVLFIYFINDMPDILDGIRVKVFADDTKIFNPIISTEDTTKLQLGLDALTKWSNDWLIRFNSSKCCVMHLGINNNESSYHMLNQQNNVILNKTTLEKDLGISIDPLLTFEQHILNTINKARSLSGLIVRSFTYKSKDIMVPLFKALIRPILEYGNAVWAPHLRKHIDAIEKVQRHFTKCIIGTKNLSYEHRLRFLRLPSLEYRRVRGDLIEMYKICNNFYDPDTTDSLFIFSKTHTRNNGLKVEKMRYNNIKYKYFFTNRVANVWNGLPSGAVRAPTVDSFQNHIDKIFKDSLYCTNIYNIIYYG